MISESLPAGRTVASTPLPVAVVDDNDDLRQLLRITLRNLGFPSESFSSGEELLSRFEPGRFSCAIVDVVMPGVSGLDLVQEMRLRDRRIPIVMLTALSDLETCRRAFKNGATEFLTKPFSPDTLSQTLGAAIHVTGHGDQRTGVFKAIEQLSPREAETLALVLNGRSVKQIAAEFNIGQQTAAKHRSRAYAKLQVTCAADVFRLLDASGVSQNEALGWLGSRARSTI